MALKVGLAVVFAIVAIYYAHHSFRCIKEVIAIARDDHAGKR
jgi:hypothetical protein